jgi:hypothetical protein
MRTAFTAVAAACALLVTAAAASGSGARSIGMLGVAPHRQGVIPSFTLHAATAPGTSGPLVYEGGRVMHTNKTYTIFWDPSGATACGGAPCTYDANYQADINQYLQNVAAASGSTSNVYSVATQYYDTGYVGAGPVEYQSTFGGTWLDTGDQFPTPNSCSDGVHAVCLDDNDFENEVAAALVANPSWQASQSSIFFVLTPDHVGSCFDPGSSSDPGQACSTTVYCAYHSGYGTEADPTIYAVEPYQADMFGCNSGESPNNDDADSTINTMSHEQNEAITDYAGDAWIANDGPGGSPQDENGDLCAWQFGAILGGAPGAEYNQVINGHGYYLQQEYSNAGNDCFPGSSALPPVDTALPAIAGTAAVSHTLSTTAGTWSGSPTRYSFQWQRCSSAGAGCMDIPDATGADYTLTAADGGQTVRSTVSASNANGVADYVDSAVSAVVVPLPATTVAPAESGVAAVGRTLSTTSGTWNGVMSFAYQWLRCDASGNNCAAIPGETDATYEIGTADGGHTIQARVSATNPAGTTAALSNHTAIVLAKPASTHKPRISGKAKSRHTLKANAGAWSGSPTFAYQWLRCNAKGARCVAIHKASKPSYRVTKRDVGHRLRVRVTGRNGAGKTVALSNATAKVHS